MTTEALPKTTKDGQWKIVDTFNGGTIKTIEGDKSRTAYFATEDDAAEWVEYLLSKGSHKWIAVVPRDATWEWNHRLNKYVWDY